jgi:hypothetical protein
LNEEKSGFMREEEDRNLEVENQNLKRQLALFQQQMEEKDRTIRLLQQQMVRDFFFKFLFGLLIFSKFIKLFRCRLGMK